MREAGPSVYGRVLYSRGHVPHRVQLHAAALAALVARSITTQGSQRRYHTHTRPYAFVNLEASLTQALAPDGGAVGEPAYQEEGQVTFVAHDQLSSHGVRNVGEQTFVQFVVEFK